MTLKVGMIADDLTGALDAAAPLAERGLRTIIRLDAEGDLPADADVLCLTTASREIAPAEAGARVASATARLMEHQPQILFKKIDSRLKGNLLEETKAMQAASGRSMALVAPAIPDLGRLVENGAVSGMGVVQPIIVKTRFEGLAVGVPNARTQDDMDAIAADFAACAGSTLAIGARGLAQALARRFPKKAADPAPRQLLRPALIAIGSRDPITREQVARIREKSSPGWIAAPNGAVPDICPHEELTLVTVEPCAEQEDADKVAARFAHGVADLVRCTEPASLLISGGETAFAILRELGVAEMRLLGEALPGVPCAMAEIDGRQVAIFTKSGGFGPPETIQLLIGDGRKLD